MNVIVKGIGSVGTRDGDLRADTAHICQYIPPKKLRRTDHFTQLALLAACYAIEDAGFKLNEFKGENIGVILATGHGAMNTTYAFKDSINSRGDSFSSPTLFSKSVHNAAMSNLTIQLGLTGPNLTISQHSFSFQSALLTACLWINEGSCEYVMVGGVDEFSETLGYCIERFNDEKKSVLDYNNAYTKKTAPGEGASFFILSKSDFTGKKEKMKHPGFISDLVMGNLTSNHLPIEIDTHLIIDGDSNRIKNWIQRDQIKNKIHYLEKPYGDFFTNPGFDLIAAFSQLEGYGNITLIYIEEEGQFVLIKLKRIRDFR